MKIFLRGRLQRISARGYGDNENFLMLATVLVAVCFILFPVIFQGQNMVNFMQLWPLGSDPWGSALVVSDQMTVASLADIQGGVPLWDFSESAGKPLAGDPSYKLFNPLSWLAVMHPTVGWLNVLLILKFFMTGVFMWRFLRAASLTRFATLFGTVLWMGNGYDLI